MPIKIECPNCSRNLEVPERLAGKRVKCPGCQNPLAVPEDVVDAEAFDVEKSPSRDDSSTNSEREDQDREPCPMCGEMIPVDAAKCRFCGEIFDSELRRMENGDRTNRRRSRFPTMVSIAGVMWIIFGALIVVSLIINLLLLNDVRPARGNDEAVAGGRICGLVFFGLFGFAFIRGGFQSMNGSAKDTMGNSIGSIVLSLLFAAVAIFGLAKGDPATGIGGLIFALGLFTPGLLALIARADYLDWKKSGRRRKGSRDRHFRNRDSDD